MNGIVTSNCCCDKTCCNVSGPSWANRYCFQMSGYEATYEWKECRSNYVHPDYGARYCENVPEQGADTDAECEANSAVCHRRLRMTACAKGAVFRGNPVHGGCCTGDCLTTCPGGPANGIGDPSCWSWEDVYHPNGYLLRPGVCDKPTWVPPDITPVGCDSNYESPPCDCTIAENDRATVKGVVQDLDLSGVCQVLGPLAPDGLGRLCVDMEETDEPYECFASAFMWCVSEDNVACSWDQECSSQYPAALRRHYFKILLGPAVVLGGSCTECPAMADVEFMFEADLGPDTPPDQATWTCIKAPVYCADRLCDTADCGDTYPDEECGIRHCDNWTACYSNADNTGDGCGNQDLYCYGCVGPATIVAPTLTFLPYQNCTYPGDC
jgi:hypothetical protein